MTMHKKSDAVQSPLQLQICLQAWDGRVKSQLVGCCDHRTLQCNAPGLRQSAAMRGGLSLQRRRAAAVRLQCDCS